MVLGENEWQAPGKTGTDGEGYDAATLELTGRQEELVRAVHATGTPTVVVLVNGRPLAIRWIAEHVRRSSRPGSRASAGRGRRRRALRRPQPERAPARHLPAARRPAPGRLQPQALEGLLAPKRWGKPYVDLDPDAALPVRPRPLLHGVRVRGPPATPERSPGGEVEVSVNVRNWGPAGRRGRAALPARPDRIGERAGAAPARLPEGRARAWRQRTVRFPLGPDELALLDANLVPVVEPGAFEVAVGSSGRRIHLTGLFEVLLEVVRGAGRAVAAVRRHRAGEESPDSTGQRAG